MKPRTIIGLLLIVAGLWKLANMWGIIENDWLWSQPWTAYIAPALLLYVGAGTIVNSYRHDPDQWLQRQVPINEDGKRMPSAEVSAWTCAKPSSPRTKRLTSTPSAGVLSSMCQARSTS